MQELDRGKEAHTRPARVIKAGPFSPQGGSLYKREKKKRHRRSQKWPGQPRSAGGSGHKAGNPPGDPAIDQNCPRPSARARWVCRRLSTSIRRPIAFAIASHAQCLSSNLRLSKFHCALPSSQGFPFDTDCADFARCCITFGKFASVDHFGEQTAVTKLVFGFLSLSEAPNSFPQAPRCLTPRDPPPAVAESQFCSGCRPVVLG